MKFKNIALGVFSLTLLVTGCYPEGAEYYSDLDLVTTDYSPEFWNTTTAQSYYMPDSLGYVTDRDNPDNNDTIVFNDNAFVLDQIAMNLELLGYERLDTIDDSNQPDLVLFTNVLVVKNTTVGYIPSYPWYGGYYPWWPGYGWGYWPGYGIPVYYSYTTGTVIIKIVDYKGIDEVNKELPVTWTAGINGLLRDSQASNKDFIANSIDQAFDQSPYLLSQ